MVRNTLHLNGEAMKSNGTPVYARQHRNGPTLPQLSAIDLLVSGKNDKETAELLGLSRTAVTKWRLYDPVFQAALNQRRAEVWGAGLDRLRSLIPKALDALAEEVESKESPNRFKAAVEVLKLVQLSSGAAGIGPTDAEEIVHGIVSTRRQRAHGPLDDLIDDGKGLPPLDKHIRDTWDELEELAKEADPNGTDRNV
jgi:hypothetical protein